MSISRRKLLSLAPASVGAIALGGLIEAKPTQRAMEETLLIAAEKAAHPPLFAHSGPVAIDEAFIRAYQRDVQLIFGGRT